MNADRGFERLPPGRHRLPLAAVAEHQRSRLLGAAAEVFYEGGYLGTTSRRIAIGAGVSSRTFYRHFEDVSDCLRAAFDSAAEVLQRRLVGDCRTASNARDAVRFGVEALLAFTHGEPRLAHLLGGELAAAEKEIAIRRHQFFVRLAASLRERAREESSAHTVSIGEQTIGAALALCLAAGHEDPSVPPDLAAQLGAMVDLVGDPLW
jgi:AcrR family transcriptional regulator